MFRSSSDGATGRCRKASSIRFIPIPEGIRLARSRNKARATGGAGNLSARLGGHVTLEAHADGNIVARFDGYSVGLGTFSAGAADRAQDLRAGLPLGSLRPARGPSTRRSISWSGDWPDSGLLEYRLGRRAKRRGRGRHRAAGSRLLAANAATRRCRRSRPVAVRVSAAARQRDGAGIAARRRAVQDLRSEDCRRHGDAVDAATNQPAPPAGRFSGRRASRFAGRLPDPFQDRRGQRQQACGRPKATTTSCSGTFTIFCSTRAAPKAGTPTRWAESIPMPASSRRCRRCGRAGPERKSICASSRPRRRSRSRRPRSFCANAIRRAIFDDQQPITLAELARFLDGTARVQSTWKAGSTSATAVRCRLRREALSVGRRQLRARALSRRQQLRGACARLLSLRCRRARAGADRRARA